MCTALHTVLCSLSLSLNPEHSGDGQLPTSEMALSSVSPDIGSRTSSGMHHLLGNTGGAEDHKKAHGRERDTWRPSLGF